MEPQEVLKRDWLSEGLIEALEGLGSWIGWFEWLPDPYLTTEKIYGGLTEASGQLLLEFSCPLHPSGFSISSKLQ